jgi:hypothetical protein
MAKGFTRLSDSIHDLALAILDAMEMLKVSTTRAVDDDWMSAPFSRTVNFRVKTASGRSDQHKPNGKGVQPCFGLDDLTQYS